MTEESEDAMVITRTDVEPATVARSLAAYQQPTVNFFVRESKYMRLLSVIQELGCHVKPFYAGRRYATEEVKKCIVNARLLVKECLLETQQNAYRENEDALYHQ